MDGIKFDDWVKKWAANVVTINEVAERLRTQSSVVLFKRNRGETLGDRIGRWNYQTNNFVEPAINGLAPFNIFTKNIVKKIVRANASTMSQAALSIDCNPRQQTTVAKKNALITSKVCEWVEQFLWTPARLHQINSLKQLTQGVFVRNYWNESLPGREYETSEFEDEEFSVPGQFSCPQCGEATLGGLENDIATESRVDPAGVSYGDNDVSMEQVELSDSEAIDAPHCETCGIAMVEIESPLTEMMPVEKRKLRMVHGDNDMRIIPSLEFRADERYSQGANMSACQWFNHHPLMSKYEIEAEFGVKDLGPASDWSYPMKWLYTLQTGTAYPFKSYKQTQETLKKLELYEVNYIYLTPEWLSSYKADVAYEFKNSRGEVEFAIEPGECARDVVLRMAKEKAEAKGLPFRDNGLTVVITGERVLGYRLGEFKREFKMTYFVSDPVSFWPLPYSELEPMQHLVNQTLTAIGNQVTSNQNVLIVDREAYDADDVEGSKNVIYTREGLDKGIGETFGIMPATPVTPDSWRMVDWADASADEVGMTSKEMQGQPSDAKTFGQAQLNRDQSVGVLTPAQQSLGECKAASFMSQCYIAQEHWPFERLRELCDSTEGLITDEDIETWYKSDLEQTVIITHRPGSEQPKTFQEKQNDVANVATFIGNFAKVAPQVLDEKAATELIAKFVGYSSVGDLDLGNREANVELAEMRFNIILENLDKQIEQILTMPPEMMPQGDITQMVVESAMSSWVLMPLPKENHAAQQEFYTDKSSAELLKADADIMVVMACQQMIERHRQAAVGEGQTLIKSQMEIEAPAREQQMAMSEHANAANADTQAQQLALETARQESADQMERERIAAENYRTEVEAGSQLAQTAIEAQNAGS